MEERHEDNSITSEISKEYIPRLVETSTFKNGNCNEKYIRSHLKLTLDDLFMVAGETQKPVGIYVDNTLHFPQEENHAYPFIESLFMIFHPKNLSVVKGYISRTLIRLSVRSLDEEERQRISRNFISQTFSFKTIEEAYNYILNNLYYKDIDIDANIDRKLPYYLTDPMSRLYVANQIFSDCKDEHRLYFSSYVEEPKLTNSSNLYYWMILVLLGREYIYKLSFADNEHLEKLLEEGRKKVLDIIRVEKATVASLTLSRYLEERELAKIIGGMTMNL